jgi:hypothetical protein
MLLEPRSGNRDPVSESTTPLGPFRIQIAAVMCFGLAVIMLAIRVIGE